MSTTAWLRPRTKIEQTPQANWPLFILAGPLLFLLVVPLLAIVMKTTPATVWQALGEESTRQAIGLSLRTSMTTTLFALVFGTPLAYLLGRRRLRMAALLEILIDLPTVLPPAVAGLALLMAFGRRGLLGGTLACAGDADTLYDAGRCDGADLRRRAVSTSRPPPWA